MAEPVAELTMVPVTPLAAGLRMTPSPAAHVPWLLAVTATYGFGAQLVKKSDLRRHEVWL